MASETPETPVTDQVSDVMHVEEQKIAGEEKVEEGTAPPSEVVGGTNEKEMQNPTESTNPEIAATVADGEKPDGNGETPSNAEHNEEEDDKKHKSEILNENGTNDETSSKALSGESTVEIENESEKGLTSISQTTAEVEKKPRETLEFSAIPGPAGQEVIKEPEEEKVKELKVEKSSEMSESFSIQKEVQEMIKEPGVEESTTEEHKEKPESSLNKEPELEAAREVEITDFAEDKQIGKSELSSIHKPEKEAVQELEVRESSERSEPSSAQEQQEQIKEPEVLEPVIEKPLETSESSSVQGPEQGELKEPEGVNSSVEKPQQTSEMASFQEPEQQPEVVEPALEKPANMIEASSIQEPEVGDPKSPEPVITSETDDNSSVPSVKEIIPDTQRENGGVKHEAILASAEVGDHNSFKNQVSELTDLDAPENITEGMLISQITDTEKSEKYEIKNGDTFPRETGLKDSIPTATEGILQEDISVEGKEMIPEFLDSECLNKTISKDAIIPEIKQVNLGFKSDVDEKESDVAALEESVKEENVKSAIHDLSVATATIETVNTMSAVEVKDNHVVVEDKVEEKTGFSFPTENRNAESKEDGSEKLVETSRDVDVDKKENTVGATLNEAPHEPKSAEFEERSEEEKKVVTEKTDVPDVAETLKDAEDSKVQAVITDQDTPAKTIRRSSGIISKVKHSIVKAKKAILGKSPSSKTVSAEAKNEIKVK